MRKRQNNRHTVLIFCLVASCLFIGCKKKDEATAVTQTPSAAGKVPSKAPIISTVNVQHQVTSSQKRQSDPTYSFKNKKDPFKPLITPPEAAAPIKVSSNAKLRPADALPIQSLETSQFTVTGIITGLKENKALLVDPVGKGYVVKLGMLIGDNGGHVSKISTSTVEVSEQYRDDKKHVKTRIIVLPLAKKSKENPR